MLWTHEASTQSEISLKEGLVVDVIQKSDISGNAEWWLVREPIMSSEGYFPAVYLEQVWTYHWMDGKIAIGRNLKTSKRWNDSQNLYSMQNDTSDILGSGKLNKNQLLRDYEQLFIANYQNTSNTFLEPMMSNLKNQPKWVYNIMYIWNESLASLYCKYAC